MKSLEQLPRWLTWGLAFPLIVVNGWLIITVFNYFQSLITTIVAATLLAFILSYPVQFLEARRFKRFYAVLVVIFVALLVLVFLGVTIAPTVIEQLNELLTRLPTWIQSGVQQLQALNDWAQRRDLPINLEGLVNQLSVRLSSQIQTLTGRVLSLVLGTVDSVVSVVLTLVLTFYLLLHGEEVWEGICQWLPEPINLRVRPLLRQNFQNYYVGQASLAAIVGVSMTIAFSLLQVPFGLLFGLVVGIGALFPFGGALSICVVSLLTALKSFWLGVRVLGIAIVLQQIIENGVAPRLLGGFTGLNPVWILVSLLAGAKLGGVVGLLIAVPVAGFIKSTAIALRSEPLTFPALDTSPELSQERL